MYPDINLFGLKIHTFGLMFGLAFVFAGGMVWRRLKEIGKPADYAYEIAFSALIGGVVGARLWYLVANWDDTKHNFFSKIFSGSGLIFYGGAIGGAAGVALWGLIRRFPFFVLADMSGPALAVGYAIGRIGCQLSGDGDYGKNSGSPWAMAYPHGTVPTTQTVEPTPVYETFTMGLLTYVLWQLRGRYRPGTLFALYMIGGGIERFLVEFIRRNPHVWEGLTTAQLYSIGMVVLGSLWILARRPKTAALAT